MIFFPLYFFHITRFHSVTSNPKSFSPAATLRPATATLDPRPRHWTRDRDIGPATATVDPRPATRDPRPATRDPRLLVKLILQHYRVFRSDFRGQPSTVNSRVLHGSLILCKTRDNRKSQREKISQIYGVASILN